jgi:hypothetical protein
MNCGQFCIYFTRQIHAPNDEGYNCDSYECGTNA